MPTIAYKDLDDIERDTLERIFGRIVRHETSEAIKLLDKNRKLLFAMDSTGHTPLDTSVFHRNEEMTEWLLRQGTDLYSSTNRGGSWRPLPMAFFHAKRRPTYYSDEENACFPRIAAIMLYYQNQIPRNLSNPQEKQEYDDDMKYYLEFMQVAPEEQKNAFFKKSNELASNPEARLSRDVIAIYEEHNRARTSVGEVKTIEVTLDGKDSAPDEDTEHKSHFRHG